MRKLFSIGIRQNAFEWFQDYLKNRQQYIQIGNIKSTTKIVENEITQGTELASTLFLIYINNIDNLELKGKMYKFADDMAITFEANNYKQLQNDINHDLNELEVWMDTNELTINISKTKVMLIKPTNSSPIFIQY